MSAAVAPPGIIVEGVEEEIDEIYKTWVEQCLIRIMETI